MRSRLALLLAVVTALLALSCEHGGHEGPAATSTPTTSARAPTTVSIAGPVLVFSSPPGNLDITPFTEQARWHWVRALDTATGARWTILEHPVRARVADTSLVAYDGKRVRRVSIDGSTEAILWEKPTQDLSVSADGTKVAIMLGHRRQGVVVLDAVTGDEIRSFTRDDLRLDRLHAPLAILGEWSTGNDAFSIDLDWQRLNRSIRELWHISSPIPPSRNTILTLDGDIREPESWLLSPDFRHALEPRFGMGSDPATAFWYRFEVIHAETGEIVATVRPEGDADITPYDWLTWDAGLRERQHVVWPSNANSYVYFEYHPPYDVRRSKSRALDDWLAWVEGREPPDLRARVLDLETGESRPLSYAEWIGDLDQRVEEVCRFGELPRSTCVLLLKGGTVSESATNFVALVELDEPLTLSAALFREPCRFPGDC